MALTMRKPPTRLTHNTVTRNVSVSRCDPMRAADASSVCIRLPLPRHGALACGARHEPFHGISRRDENALLVLRAGNARDMPSVRGRRELAAPANISVEIGLLVRCVSRVVTGDCADV